MPPLSMTEFPTNVKPVFKGFLSKEGSSRLLKRWHRRYFVLYPGLMSVNTTQHHKAPSALLLAPSPSPLHTTGLWLWTVWRAGGHWQGGAHVRACLPSAHALAHWSCFGCVCVVVFVMRVDVGDIASCCAPGFLMYWPEERDFVLKRKPKGCERAWQVLRAYVHSMLTQQGS